jgi:hypothetical protein
VFSQVESGSELQEEGVEQDKQHVQQHNANERLEPNHILLPNAFPHPWAVVI